MASTVTVNHRFHSLKFGTINLGTYATGGIAVTGAQVECPNQIKHLSLFASGGYQFEYVPSSGKIKAYQQKDPAAAGGADIPLPEVGNSTNLGSINPQFIAIGF